MKEINGFTLIELMIVVAIIALLASVALPKFANTTDAAKAANVQGNLANLRTAISMFKAKEGEYPTQGNGLFDFDQQGDLSVKFQNYYSKSSMPYTPKFDGSGDSASQNNVTTGTSDNGGWVYTEASGEIHADILENAYEQAIDWDEE